MNKIPDLTNKKLKAINLGLKSFYESLKCQDTPVVHIDWKPPAGGNKKMLSILEKIR